MDKPISSLRNLGPVTESMLSQVGIVTSKELLKQEPVEVYQLLRLFGFKVNINMLWVLYGAINDCDWRQINEETKKQLRRGLEKIESL